MCVMCAYLKFSSVHYVKNVGCCLMSLLFDVIEPKEMIILAKAVNVLPNLQV